MKRILKRTLYILIIISIFVTSMGCTTNRDIENPNVESSISKIPERIISLAPSNTEILFALGLGDKIVGVTSFCDYPEEALEKEKVGDYSSINLERIIELEPDLVVNYGGGDKEANHRLKEAGIQVIGYLPESIDEIIEAIESIGKITGTQDRAEEVIAEILQKRDEIVEKVKDTEKKRVFYEIWHEPLQGAGSGSFMDSLIQLANGDNIAKDAKGEYPLYDIEQLIERDPEVYLTSADMPEKTIESIKARPGYSEITAIKEEQIYILDANVTSRPGPRIMEALELVAKAIHPEVFE